VAPAALAGSGWDEAALAAGPPLLAGFWAQWCLPSHALAGALEEAAARYAGRLRVGLVDADREPALAERYRIRGLPTVLLLRDGREVLRRVGLLTREELLKLLDASLAGRR
jgi:thioredoxin-like negative regulator of GroEL